MEACSAPGVEGMKRVKRLAQYLFLTLDTQVRFAAEAAAVGAAASHGPVAGLLAESLFQAKRRRWGRSKPCLDSVFKA